MIGGGPERGLIDRSAFKQLGIALLPSMTPKDARERVWGFFQPKLVRGGNICHRLDGKIERYRLTSTHNDILRIDPLRSTSIQRTRNPYVFELPHEPLVPIFESIIFSRGITIKFRIVDPFLSSGTEPSVRLLFI